MYGFSISYSYIWGNYNVVKSVKMAVVVILVTGRLVCTCNFSPKEVVLKNIALLLGCTV